jgi:hypothetical protein
MNNKIDTPNTGGVPSIITTDEKMILNTGGVPSILGMNNNITIKTPEGFHQLTL